MLKGKCLIRSAGSVLKPVRIFQRNTKQESIPYVYGFSTYAACRECNESRCHTQSLWTGKSGFTINLNSLPSELVHSRLSSTSTDKHDVIQPSTKKKKKDSTDTIVKVSPKSKKGKRAKTDFSKSYTENIFITPARAMGEYLIKSGDLNGIKTTKRRSPYPEKEDITVYLRKDVERKAIEVWGTLDNLQKEKQRRLQMENTFKSPESGGGSYSGGLQLVNKESIFKSGPGKVVVYAIVINGVNCAMKFGAWLYTGSHSMFAEAIHSLADTANQIILAIGLHQSLKQADMEHPYGWANFRNVSSLISGVGIFCIGAGLSWYHGIQGLLHPEHIESLFWGTAILGGSFVSEGATLMVAINQIRREAGKQRLSFFDYVWRGYDPSTNVVLFEDLAAVTGVACAASCMALSYYTGNMVFDAVGSLIVGTLLGSVASIIIYTNTVALVGRSIPVDKRTEMMKELEADRMIRALHDVKATNIGGDYVRFKAEVDFDGKEITRLYLEKLDLETLLAEVKNFETIEEMENFLLKHGENIVDTLGSEVDRIEKNLKRQHPEIRHVDLEQL